MVRAPTEWRARGWITFAAFVTAVTVACVEKRPLQSLISTSRPHASWLEIPSIVGSGWALDALCITIWLASVPLKRARATAHVTSVAAIWCFVAVKVGQFILAEDRPLDGGAMHFFRIPGHGLSGHACVAALLILPLVHIAARDFGKTRRVLVAIVLVAWALFVGWSRVRMNMHHVWNVLLGWGAGLFVANVVVNEWHAMRVEQEREHHKNATPVA